MLGFCSKCFASGVEVMQLKFSDKNPNSGRYVCKMCLGDPK